MRTMIAIAAIALVGTMTAQAQTAKPSPMDRTWAVLNTEQLNLQLGLNDEQQRKVKDIDTRYISKHQGLEQSTPALSEKEMSDKTAALMNERDREMSAVLTPEQYKKWDEMRQKGTSDLTPEKKEKMK